MNILVLGMANKEQYIKGLLEYARGDTDLYTFESHFSEALNEAAEELNVKLFVKNFFSKSNKVDKILYFTHEPNVTEVMVLTEALAHSKPIIFIPI